MAEPNWIDRLAPFWCVVATQTAALALPLLDQLPLPPEVPTPVPYFTLAGHLIGLTGFIWCVGLVLRYTAIYYSGESASAEEGESLTSTATNASFFWMLFPLLALLQMVALVYMVLCSFPLFPRMMREGALTSPIMMTWIVACAAFVLLFRLTNFFLESHAVTSPAIDEGSAPDAALESGPPYQTLGWREPVPITRDETPGLTVEISRRSDTRRDESIACQCPDEWCPEQLVLIERLVKRLRGTSRSMEIELASVSDTHVLIQEIESRLQERIFQCDFCRVWFDWRSNNSGACSFCVDVLRSR